MQRHNLPELLFKIYLAVLLVKDTAHNALTALSILIQPHYQRIHNGLMMELIVQVDAFQGFLYSLLRVFVKTLLL